MKKTILSIMLILPMISFSQDSINQKDEDQQHPRAEALRARLNAAVEKGTITQEQADKRYEGFMRKVESPDDKPDMEARYKRLGVNDLSRIKTKLKESGITNGQLDLVLSMMIRVIHVAKDQGKEFDFNFRFQNYFENKVGLNDVQIQVVKGISRRIAHQLQ